MAETAQLGSATMKILDRDFGLRPGMDTDAIRAAMHKERNHRHSSPEGYIEGADGGKKLKIGQDAYTPGQLKALLDAQALPAQEPGARLPGRTIQEITASIRAHAAMMARGYIAIGRDLIEAKALLGHGKFLPWLAEMGFGVSAANKYMQLAAEIAQGSPLEELPYSKALALIALPAGEREAFAAENEVENKSAAEIRRLIAERDQMKRERDSLSGAYEKAHKDAAEWKREADSRERRIRELEERPAIVQQVVETPDDYQALKLAAAHHQVEMEEAAQAAEEAEARAAAAEAELARVKREGAQAGDKYTAVMGAANTFLMAVQLLPYDREELRGMYNRQRYTGIVKSVRDWCDEMADALEGGALDGEGAVI